MKRYACMNYDLSMNVLIELDNGLSVCEYHQGFARCATVNEMQACIREARSAW